MTVIPAINSPPLQLLPLFLRLLLSGKTRDLSAETSVTEADPPLLVRALRGERTARAPFWFMRQAGRYLPEYRALRQQSPDFVRFCLNPPHAAEVTLQPLRRFGMDAAILFADILLIPHALDVDLVFKEGEGPVLSPVRDAAAVDRLEKAAPAVAGRLAAVYETVSRVRGALDPDKALIGFAGSPWTVATYMVEGGGGHDFRTVRRFALTEPDLFQRLVDVLVDTTIAYLDRQIQAGADAVQLFDTWASALPAAEFERWCVAPTAAIVTALRARHPHVPIIGFARGAGTGLVRYATATRIDAIGLDAGVAPAWAADQLPQSLCLQGNLDPLLIAIGGTAMDAAAHAILSAWRQRAFVFNLGHGITPDVPIANVDRLSAILHAWRREQTS
jgi:uroporphyrinogen decarboxylase